MAAGTRRRWTRAFFLKAKGGFVAVVARFPWRIRALLVRARKPPRVRPHFIRAFGHPTFCPPVRRPTFVGRIAECRPWRLPRQPIRPVIHTRVFGHATGRPPIRKVAFYGRIAAWLLALRPRITLRTIIRTTRVFGHATRNPPIRAIRTVLFSSQAMRHRLALRTRAMVFGPVGFGVPVVGTESLFTLISSSFGTLKITGTLRSVP